MPSCSAGKGARVAASAPRGTHARRCARVVWRPAVLSVPARGPLSVSAAPQALAADAQPALAAALRALLALGLAPTDASRALRRFPRALRLAPGRLAGAAGRLERLGVPPGAVPGVLRAAPGVLDAAEPRLVAALAGLQARWAHASRRGSGPGRTSVAGALMPGTHVVGGRNALSVMI